MQTPIIASALVLLLASATLRAQSPPANDNFANRQVLPSELTVTVSGTTIGSTQEGFEITNAGGSPAGQDINETRTVWYDYTAPVAGNAHLADFTDHGGGLTYLLVFEGTDPDLAHLVFQGYLPGSGEANFPVAAGQEYVFSLGNTSFPGGFAFSLVDTPTGTPTPTPAPPPVAGVTAKGDKADRATAMPGKLVFTLSAAASVEVTIAYKADGSAVAGTDYKPLSGSVTIPAGQTSATVKVKPRAVATPGATEPTVAVKVKLQAGDGYTVGSASEAKVKIIGGP